MFFEIVDLCVAICDTHKHPQFLDIIKNNEGHRLGEYAAMYAAGVLSLADTLYLVGHRCQMLVERCETSSCAMLSIPLPVATIRAHLQGVPSCGLACINSSSTTVVSGPIEQLERLQSDLTAQHPSIRAKMLNIPFAIHSSQMSPILPDYMALAGGVTYSAPEIPVASTLLACIVDGPDVFNPEYMAQQTRQRVEFD